MTSQQQPNWADALPPPNLQGSVQHLPDRSDPSLNSRGPPKYAVGLENTGVLCYQSSVFQTLLFYPRFANWLDEHQQNSALCLQETHRHEQCSGSLCSKPDDAGACTEDNHPSCKRNSCDQCCKTQNCVLCRLKLMLVQYRATDKVIPRSNFRIYRQRLQDLLDISYNVHVANGRAFWLQRNFATASESTRKQITDYGDKWNQESQNLSAWDYRGDEQGDCSELLQWLKDNIAHQVRRSRVVNSLFSILDVVERRVCEECHEATDDGEVQSGFLISDSRRWRQGQSLVEHVDAFFAADQNAPRRQCESETCQRAKRKHIAKKYISDLPDLVRIQLQDVVMEHVLVKGWTILGIPGVIDLSQHVARPAANMKCRYQLHAVIAHQGHETSGGHYKTILKDTHGHWIELDDNEVSGPFETDVGNPDDVAFEARMGYPKVLTERWGFEKEWTPFMVFYRIADHEDEPQEAIIAPTESSNPEPRAKKRRSPGPGPKSTIVGTEQRIREQFEAEIERTEAAKQAKADKRAKTRAEAKKKGQDELVAAINARKDDYERFKAKGLAEKVGKSQADADKKVVKAGEAEQARIAEAKLAEKKANEARIAEAKLAEDKAVKAKQEEEARIAEAKLAEKKAAKAKKDEEARIAKAKRAEARAKKAAEAREAIHKAGPKTPEKQPSEQNIKSKSNSKGRGKRVRMLSQRAKDAAASDLTDRLRRTRDGRVKKSKSDNLSETRKPAPEKNAALETLAEKPAAKDPKATVGKEQVKTADTDKIQADEPQPAPPKGKKRKGGEREPDAGEVEVKDEVPRHVNKRQKGGNAAASEGVKKPQRLKLSNPKTPSGYNKKPLLMLKGPKGPPPSRKNDEDESEDSEKEVEEPARKRRNGKGGRAPRKK